MASSSIANDLLQIINENPYKTVFTHLQEDNVVAPEVIKALKKDHMKGRVYDTSQFQNRTGTIMPDGMYSLFTKYAGKDCDEIRDNLSSWAHSNETELKVLTKDAFDNHKYNLNMWTLMIINK